MSTCVKIENKYEEIVVALKQQIRQGFLSGQIPGQRQLADRFNVNVITLRKALSRLEKEGLLEKHPCKGVFVRQKLDIQKHETVALMLFSHGHLYHDMAAVVAHQLQDCGFYSMLLDTDWRRADGELLQKQIIRLISSNPAGLIVDGHRYFPFDTLREYRQRIGNLVFMFRNAAPDIEGDNVLTDHFSGGYQGTEYLLGRGRRKILFVMPPPPRLYYDAVFTLDGAKKALAEHKIEFTPEMVIDYQEEFFENGRYELLEKRLRQYRPDAVFVFADYMARPFYEVAAAMGLSIPDNLAILGYYNTPWSTSYRIPMSTISVNWKEIGIQTAECLTSRAANPGLPWRNIIIKPNIVERFST